MQCEPPSLDGGQPLADRVDLHDICAAGQQLAGDILQLGKRHQRRLKQRRTAAGDEKQHAVLLLQAARQFQRGLRGAEPGLVRHRMSGLKDAQRADRAAAVVVFGDDCAGRDARAEHGPRRICHGPRGLSDGNEYDTPRAGKALQCTRYGSVWLHGAKTCADDLIGGVTKCHKIRPFPKNVLLTVYHKINVPAKCSGIKKNGFRAVVAKWARLW